MPYFRSKSLSRESQFREARLPYASSPAHSGPPQRGSASDAVPSDPVSHRKHRNADRNASLTRETSQDRIRILFVSDFFYPQLGGVEMHQFQLAQCLMKRGHKVVVLTHAYGNRKGVRYMTNGLKVYYIPQLPIYNQNSLPTVFCAMPLLRDILVRERIDLVHAHQAFSTLAHESLFHASLMGYRTCFTDHSLFGFRDASSIHMNKLLKLTLCDVNHVICVSNTSKENTVLRAMLDPLDVSVIPNAVDSSNFYPTPFIREPNKVTIVVVSRLTYRKGVDLLVGVIPTLCAKYRNLHFVIGGDGPKRLELEEMREKHQLHDRVELLGAIAHKDVQKVLARGQIFLNCSLTEAFCIAIVEAASCGLLVVSTAVGGVPEVLPPDMIQLSKPNTDDLIVAVDLALKRVDQVDPWKFHRRIQQMYDWNYVAERTDIVYRRILMHPPSSLIRKIHKLSACGSWAGKLFCCIVAAMYLFWCLLEVIRPREQIDIAPEFPTHEYSQHQQKNSQKDVNR